MKVRNRKELRKVLMRNQKLFSMGLCLWVHELHIKKEINLAEVKFLRNLIDKNQPKLEKNFRGYYWSPGKIEPRIRWLNTFLVQEIRDKKELGNLLLGNKNLFEGGLCGWVAKLADYNLINKGEFFFLLDLIEDIPPRNTYDSVYYWEHGKIEPRIKWIKKYLLEEEEKETLWKKIKKYLKL